MKMDITQQQFKMYLNVQMSGVTNMFDIKTVSMLTGLDKNQILDIMQNYSSLKTKYNL